VEELQMELRENDLIFAKTKENAIIPTKRLEDAGYDIYTCETETIVIPPNTTRMIDTGIAIACHYTYFPKFFDKGGMGSKGIIVGAGVGDSGFRDSYFIPLINTNGDKHVVITNQKIEKEFNMFNLNTKEFVFINTDVTSQGYDLANGYFYNAHNYVPIENCIIKPLSKAITQFVMLPVPQFDVKETSWEELQSIASERGLGKLGSSGK
jgi:dUTP pyrophosphatase